MANSVARAVGCRTSVDSELDGLDFAKNCLRSVRIGMRTHHMIVGRVDNALTRDRANFMDFGHYRAIIARRMEQGIAESIKSGDKARIEF